MKVEQYKKNHKTDQVTSGNSLSQIAETLELDHLSLSNNVIFVNVVSPTSTPETHSGKELIGNFARATPQHKAQIMHCEHDRL